MTLCDAGPLVALIDKREPSHQRVSGFLTPPRLPLITTWPALTEAAYLLYQAGGWPFQEKLWVLVARRTLTIYLTPAAEQPRMRDLMAQYRNVPMDLADASLVAAAETLSLRRILTLDSDFRVYRLSDGTAFDLLPT